MEQNIKKSTIFLATGGSGGHIFPSLAVAEKLKEEGYNTCILADSVYTKYSKKGVNYRIIDATKKLKTFSDIKKIFNGFLQAKYFIKRKKPKLVISFGSYATLPTLLACLWTKTPFILHEQNAYIGKINKLFVKFSKKIMTTYHELYGIKFDDMNKMIYTGSPVRDEIVKNYNNEYKYPKANEKFNILITGGSAGAKIFSEFLPKVFDEKHKKQQEKIKIFHQVREEYLKEVQDYYNKIELDAVVSTFFINMAELLKNSNLIIGRSGSGTLCETAVSGKPSILIPLKTSANNHQEVNARNFERNGASIVVLESELNIEEFRDVLFNLIKDEKKLKSMAENAKNLAVINSKENIFNVIKEFL